MASGSTHKIFAVAGLLSLLSVLWIFAQAQTEREDSSRVRLFPLSSPQGEPERVDETQSRVLLESTTGLPRGFIGPAIRPQTTHEGEETIEKLTYPGKVVIEFPTPGEIVKKNDVEIFIRTEDGTSDLRINTFHVFLNNDPPFVHKDERHPVILKGLSEGGHMVRVLAVRLDGSAFPPPNSFAVVRFFVKRKDFRNFVDMKKPYLTVNQPANGAISEDKNGRVRFDFIIHNVKLGKDGYKLRYFLNHQEHIVAKPGPIYWSNLAPGRHSLLVDLISPSGNPVMGLFNRVERNFELTQILQPLIPESGEFDEWEEESDFYPDELNEDTLF